MSTNFRYLFTPIQIGPVSVRNRIVITPHLTGFSENNLPTERHLHYYEERAKGGVGLIVSEGYYVHPSAVDRLTIAGFDPRVVPISRRIAAAVHQHGAKLFAQVTHRGRQATTFESAGVLWAPSAVPCPSSRVTPREMDAEDIAEIVEGYARTASNLREAGYDGIEIQGGHGHLIHQFMSHWSNRRQDEYGGGLDGRLRFAREVMSAVRDAAGDGMAMGMRLSGDELTPGGLTLPDMQEIARLLEADGLLDYFSVSVGNGTAGFITMGDMTVPLGAIVNLAAGIKQAVSLPVFTVLRINDPVQAERIIAEGQADMVGMVRALIADPELPNKARDGRLDEIRYCVACVQDCRRTPKGGRLGCQQNVAVGEEDTLGSGTLEPAERERKVVIVGGGPAGMEAARVASLRGHKVTLFEQSNELGGQVLLAAKLGSREEFGGVARFLRKEMARLGVDVRLGSPASPDSILAEKPDAVIIATGSRPLPASLPSAHNGSVVNVHDVLEGRAEVGQNVVIFDGGEGFWQSCGLAELLASKEGKKVELVSRLAQVGADIPILSLPLLLKRLYAAGVVLTPMTVVTDYVDRSAIGFHIHSKAEWRRDDVDTVILVTQPRAQNGLHKALKGKVPELFAVGDCLAPRKTGDAIRDGHMAGRAV